MAKPRTEHLRAFVDADVNPERELMSADADSSEPPSLQHISDLLSYRISVLNRAFEQEAGRNLARQHELSLTEARVLGVLEELSTATVKRLAHVMRLKRPQVSRALTLLRSQGLVAGSDNPADGRSTNYTITKAGQQRVRRLLGIASVYHHERIAVLTPEERAVLERALDKLLFRTEEVDDA